MIRHVTTRWLSLQEVLMRIHEQYENLCEYFLKTVPTQTGFKGKNGVGVSERYSRIKKILTSKKLLSIMSAVINLAQEFKNFTLPIQSTEPMITVLFSKMQKLIQGLLLKFMKEDILNSTSKSLRPVAKIRKIDLSDISNQTAKCSLGSRTEKHLATLDALERKQVDDLMKKFLVATCNYVLKNLPLDNQLIKDARYLHPNSQGNPKSLEAIDRLLMGLWDALGHKKNSNVFNLNPNCTKYNLSDLVKKELTEFRIENLPNDFLAIDESALKTQLAKPSYWRDCYDMHGLKCHASETKVDVESYWRKVMLLVDEDGKQKYVNLARLALQILLLPHGNADPERGFSVNKRLLEKHSNNISEDTLESIRITKDFIIQSGGQANVKVTTEMIEKCKVSNI